VNTLGLSTNRPVTVEGLNLEVPVPRPATDSKQRILTVAARLFKAKGYAGTTMDEVAAAAKINKATVYHYFASKAELLRAIYLESADIALDAVSSIPPEMPADKAIKQLVQTLLEAIRRRPNESAVYFQEMQWIQEWLPRRLHREVQEKESSYYGLFKTLFERGISDGTLGDIDPAVAARALTGILGWATHWIRPGAQSAKEDHVTELIDVILHGLVGAGRGD
jgi:AcrR family transcriptional regulator